MNKILKEIIILLVAGLIITSCSNTEEKMVQDPSIPVKVLQARHSEVPSQFQFTGRVVSNQNTLLSTKLQGTISHIPEAGRAVKKGQLLVKIRDNELMAKLGSARATLNETQASLENTQKKYKRVQRLFEKGSATQQELDDIRAAYEMSEARAKAMAENVAELDELLNYTRLISPFDGFISKKMASVGDITTPGSPLLALESLRELKIEINVPEFEIVLLQEKAPVSIVVPALSNRSFKGWVDKIVPSSEYSGSQYQVTVRFKGVTGMKPGMYAEVGLPKGVEQKLLIPQTAIQRRGQLTGLYGINQNKEAMLRWVRLGRSYSDGVEVLSGLSEGDQVIISADGKLFDGAKIEIIN